MLDHVEVDRHLMRGLPKPFPVNPLAVLARLKYLKGLIDGECYDRCKYFNILLTYWNGKENSNVTRKLFVSQEPVHEIV
jgi:hypothetical protein